MNKKVIFVDNEKNTKKYAKKWKKVCTNHFKCDRIYSRSKE
jgi:hypothetical protein